MAIITISRGTFSGGQQLAECLAAKLGYESLSREILVEAAEKYGISENELTNAIKAKPAIVERLSLNIDRVRYLSFIQATLCEHVKNDNVVYYGHAGHLLLKDVCRVIKVKVIATMEQRLAFAMDRNKLSREDAILYIKKMDKYRQKWTKFLYGIDWNDPSLYDVVVNLKDTSIETACDMISVMTSASEFQLTENTKKAIADLSLESQIKAKLASDKMTKDYMLKIAAEDGHVVISGRVKNADHANKIRTVVREIPEVKSLDCSCIDYYLNDDVIL
ncbi:MAG: cytidylate kinase family protein [Bacteroidetes bacterium]|nr:cytidylate kinase family protein [Bacteroidota bacterium]MCL5268905.1 cytidylate kinase family protein [Bacteroidota bacterium]